MFKSLNLLLTHPVLMIELCDDILHLLLLLSSVLLHHLQVLLIPRLLIPQLLLVVLDGRIVSFLRAFTLLLEASLEAVSLDLKEGLKLSELLLRLLLHLTEGLLEFESLILQLPLQLGVSLLGTILTLF